jgi:hypothetical protein
MQPQTQQADQQEVAKFLRVITDGWQDIADEQPQLELRCIGLGGQVSVSRFAHNDIEEAAHHAVAMNEHHRNVYACINPIKPDADRRGAKDEDVLAAFYCFADADNSDSMRNVTAFAGPKFVAVSAHRHRAVPQRPRILAPGRACQKPASVEVSAKGHRRQPADR